ncbi:MAG TPA: fused MFS/spermidine synthase [Candidatus Sumerlaeota bacterium]|nr:fused MFS/spermidine synthase [Candidatus Sumerlaeota bacterium]
MADAPAPRPDHAATLTALDESGPDSEQPAGAAAPSDESPDGLPLKPYPERATLVLRAHDAANIFLNARRSSFVYLLLLGSGACGLIYEIVWTRMLTLVFGVSVYAITSVLCAFMLGLALGSWVLGRLADRVSRPLRLYGALEITIGATALAFPWLIDQIEPLFVWINRQIGEDFLLFSIARFAIILPLMLLPTFFMGGTLPVVYRFFARGGLAVARELSFLYAANTFGAVLGTFLAGFILVEVLGMQGTILMAAAINLLIGAGAILLDRRPSRPTPQSEPRQPSLHETGTHVAAWDLSAGRRQLVLGAIGLSGFCSMGMQVLWNRMLVFHVHNSTYAFSAILMVFLIGLSGGSWLLGWIAPRLRRPLTLFAVLEGLIGLWCILTLLLNGKLTWFSRLLAGELPWDNWYEALALIFIQSAALLLIPTTLMGMTLPLATRLIMVGAESAGRKVGNAYAANTVGAVAGAFAIGFILLSTIGVRESAILLGGILAAVSAVLLLAGHPPRSGWRVCAGAGCVLLVIVAAVGIPRDALMRVFAERLGKVLFYKEEVTDTLMVVDMYDSTGTPRPEQRWLVFNDGRGSAGHLTRQDNAFNGHLPMLLHADPKVAAVICIGAANTIAAMAAHKSLERLDAVDLSAGIAEASTWFESNEGILAPPRDPRIHLHVDDGRSFLLGSRYDYDVIQIEPPELHSAGVVFLYTEEFYRIARSRLKPGGILSMWINAFMLGREELRQTITAFHRVFPNGAVWQTPVFGHFIFLGTEEPLHVDLAGMYERIQGDPRLAENLERNNLRDPASLLALLLMRPETIARYCRGAQTITDDRTRIDFTNPRSALSGYGLIHLHSAIGFDIFYQRSDAVTRPLRTGGWAEISNLVRNADSILPLIDWTGLSEEERDRATARIDAVMDLRRAVASEFAEGMIPNSPFAIEHHWLGSMLAPDPDPDVVYTLTPRLRGEFAGAPFELNELGLRDEELESLKRKEFRRILVVGDEVTFGAGVEAADGYVARTERMLNQSVGADARPVQLINAGIPGYTGIQKAALAGRLARELDVEGVIIQHRLFDEAPIPLLAHSDFLTRRDLFGAVLSDVFTTYLGTPAGLRRGLDPLPFSTGVGGQPSSDRQRADLGDLDRMAQAYAELKAECAAADVGLAILVAPDGQHGGGERDPALNRLADLGLPVWDAAEMPDDSAGDPPSPNTTRSRDRSEDPCLDIEGHARLAESLAPPMRSWLEAL